MNREQIKMAFVAGVAECLADNGISVSEFDQMLTKSALPKSLIATGLLAPVFAATLAGAVAGKAKTPTEKDTERIKTQAATLEYRAALDLLVRRELDKIQGKEVVL